MWFLDAVCGSLRHMKEGSFSEAVRRHRKMGLGLKTRSPGCRPGQGVCLMVQPFYLAQFIERGKLKRQAEIKTFWAARRLRTLPWTPIVDSYRRKPGV